MRKISAKEESREKVLGRETSLDRENWLKGEMQKEEVCVFEGSERPW